MDNYHFTTFQQDHQLKYEAHMRLTDDEFLFKFIHSLKGDKKQPCTGEEMVQELRRERETNGDTFFI